MFFEHVLITLPSSNSISTDFTIFHFPIPNSIPIYIFSELISPILSHCNYTQSNLYKMNTLGTSQKWSSWASGCPLKHLNKKNFMTFFMDGVQLPQGYSHFEKAVYFLPYSSQKFLTLILLILEGLKAVSTLEPPIGFEHRTPGKCLSALTTRPLLHYKMTTEQMWSFLAGF